MVVPCNTDSHSCMHWLSRPVSLYYTLPLPVSYGSNYTNTDTTHLSHLYVVEDSGHHLSGSEFPPFVAAGPQYKMSSQTEAPSTARHPQAPEKYIISKIFDQVKRWQQCTFLTNGLMSWPTVVINVTATLWSILFACSLRSVALAMKVPRE